VLFACTEVVKQAQGNRVVRGVEGKREAPDPDSVEPFIAWTSGDLVGEDRDLVTGLGAAPRDPTDMSFDPSQSRLVRSDNLCDSHVLTRGAGQRGCARPSVAFHLPGLRQQIENRSVSVDGTLP